MQRARRLSVISCGECRQAKHHDVSAPTAELPGLWAILAAAAAAASAAAVNPGPTRNESLAVPGLVKGVMLHANPSQKIRPVKIAPKKERLWFPSPAQQWGRVETLVL